jgi:hypothetical protein
MGGWIGVDLGEIGWAVWSGFNWGSCEHCDEPSGSGTKELLAIIIETKESKWKLIFDLIAVSSI